MKIAALTALTLVLLTGCGRSATTATIAPIDSVFTRQPAETAAQTIGVQQQERKESESKSGETSRVSVPKTENQGFRRD